MIIHSIDLREELRVGIVGSRRRNTMRDIKIVYKIVEELLADNPDRKLVIVSGACPKGADAFAAEASRVLGVELKEFPVPKVPYANKWEFAQAAFARNKLIAEDSFVGFALVTPDRTGGTEDTIKHFNNLKRKVYLVDGNGRYYLSSVEEKNARAVPKDPDKT